MNQQAESEPRKTALIVGTKRVGQVVAQRLAVAGVNLAIAYRSSDIQARDLAASITGVDTMLIRADMSVETDVISAIDQTAATFGKLDYLINLASDYPYTPFDALDSEAWDHAMATAKGSYLLAVHAARLMRRNPGPDRGHIIMFGDWAAEETPYTDYLPYLTAKAAVHFMTRCLAAELAPSGIRVNTIAPGPTMRPPEIPLATWNRDIASKAPLQIESSVDDIAEMIAAIIRTTTITGEIIRVDSGRHIRGV